MYDIMLVSAIIFCMVNMVNDGLDGHCPLASAADVAATLARLVLTILTVPVQCGHGQSSCTYVYMSILQLV